MCVRASYAHSQRGNWSESCDDLCISVISDLRDDCSSRRCEVTNDGIEMLLWYSDLRITTETKR